MADFKNQVESALLDVFEGKMVTTEEIEHVAEQADSLHTVLESDDDFDYNLTIDLLTQKMEERSDIGPKGAWNSWIGQIERYGIVPKGYQL